MEFLAPLMLLGTVGIAVPIVIHLIGRRRARVVRFAALDFLIGTNRKIARRLMLRELLLLFTRILVCLAIPLALAKPITSCTSEGPLVERGPQAAVLVIDDSFAMRYHDQGETLLDRAKQRAQSILEQLGDEADVAILRTTASADTTSELSRDHIRLRDTISQIESTWRPADTTTALRRAAQLLASSPHQRNTIYLLSALAATGFRPDDPPWPPGTGPALAIVPLAQPDTLDNLAITDLQVESDPSSGSRGIRVTAEIANFGDQPITDHGIDVRVADQVVARGLIDVKPGERLKRRFLATLPPQTRSTDVEVELAADNLNADNRRYVRAVLREEVRALLVNGDPRTDRHEDELFYLEAALRPGDRGDSGVALTTTTVDELDRLNLADFDVVVLANVVALEAERVAHLVQWVHEGGGLLITVGDNVDADAYDARMHALLPQSLRTPIDIAYGSRGAESEGRALRLAKLDVDHPVFSVFTTRAPGLRGALFTKIMLLGPTSRVDDRKVLARYTNGASALVEARSGKGRVMLFTSSIDRAWNDLPIHPGYLPMMQQLVRYLARKPGQPGRRSVLVGRSALIRVGPDDTRLEIRAPGDTHTVIESEVFEGRKLTRFDATDRPGFYRVLATDRVGKTRAREEATFAVNLDPRGSDLRTATADQLPTAGAATATLAGTSHQRRVELWHALAIGLLLLLLLESVLVLR